MANRALITLLILSLLSVVACSGKKQNEGNQSNAGNLTNKERQYFSNGKQLYETLCINCHMDQGEGLGKLIPPLSGSDYLLQNVNEMSKIIKFGMDGPVTVNGVEYNQPMPANPRLTNLEVAEILTYITNSWGNAHGPVSLDDVAEGLKEKAN